VKPELIKIAITRWQKELAAGNPEVQRRFLPAESQLDLPQTREQFRAGGAHPDPARLERLNEALYRNRMKGEGMMAVPHIAGANVAGVNIVSPHAANDIERMLKGQNMSLFNKLKAGVRAGKAAYGVGKRLGQGEEASGDLMAPLVAALAGETTERGRHPAHGTMQRAILEHEMAEGRTMGRGDRLFHASHLGPEPILAENLAAVGSPQAQELLKRTRLSNPDDALMRKKITQYGGTSGAPLPIGGRGQQNLEKFLMRNPDRLTQGARIKGIQAAVGETLMGTPTSGKTIVTPPTMDAINKLYDASKNPAFTTRGGSGLRNQLGRLRSAIGAVGQGVAPVKQVIRYIKGGV